MKKSKVDAKSLRRLRLREEFSSEYKELNKLIRANASTFYAIFKYSFYKVQNGKELLEKKNLRGKNLAKYLDYVDDRELKYLIKGVKKINALCAEPSKNFMGYPNIYNEIYKFGAKSRYQFFKTFNVYPEDNPTCHIATKYVKSAVQNQSINFTDKKSLRALQTEFELLKNERDRLSYDIDAVQNEIDKLQNEQNQSQIKEKNI